MRDPEAATGSTVREFGDNRHTPECRGKVAPPPDTHIGVGVEAGVATAAGCAGATTEVWEAPAREVPLDGGTVRPVATKEGTTPAAAGTVMGNGPAELVRAAVAVLLTSAATGIPALPCRRICT